MVIKNIAPYGDWESPITSEAIIFKSTAISFPLVDRRTGRAFYIESRENGDDTFMEILDDKVVELLPGEYAIGNTVYGYGAGVYEILPDGRLIFSNTDGTVRILDPDSREVSLLVKKEKLIYGSFSANSKSSWVLAVEEDRADDTPYGIKNFIVAINTETGEVKRVVSGADFYFSPSFSLDGTKLSWLQWNHPDLVFDAAQVHWADWGDNASVKDSRVVTGQNRESAAEPRWGIDGSLFFGQEVHGYRQLFRIAPGDKEPVQLKLKGLEKSEFGMAAMSEGSRTYIPLSERKLFAFVTHEGVSRLIVIDVATGEWRQAVDTDTVCSIVPKAIASLNESSVLVVGKGIAEPPILYKFDLDTPGSKKIIRTSTGEVDFKHYYSKPETLRFPSKGAPSRDIFGFLWMPHSPKFKAQDGELPPLIIESHGGPTGLAASGLSLWTQYFTSRGYAYVLLNYSGSIGYGRDYRQKLFGNWGIMDSDDAAECANHLISTGRVRQGGVGITGMSAGGYNTLQCITRYPETFAGAVCVCGVSDVKGLDEKIHKLESDYVSPLIFQKDTTEEDKQRIYRERSPIYHADKIESPLLLLHGTADTVVPVEQAISIAETLEKKGGDVKLLTFEGEGHMMSTPATRTVWLAEEEKWWRKTLLEHKEEE